ncbi:MAG: hypothetical protein JWQ43_2501 [Glaciihabitans sp.]|nr:hypothetical protein [Glaciihabitans sp.]
MKSNVTSEGEAKRYRSPRPASSPKPRWRTLTRSVAAAAVTLALVFAGGAIGATAASAAAPQTVVSLTFDDGHDNQMAGEAVMKQNGLKGTFYITSGYVGGAGFMTRANLDKLKADGQEIGGHTVNHPDLPTIGSAEAKRQICNDRSVLTSWGFSVRSFAYPFASSTPAIEKLVKDCGFNSARMLGDIKSRFGCTDCAYSETIPPANPYYIKALDQVDSTWTLNDLKAAVTNAEANGGGWVPLTFHELCTPGTAGCADPSTTQQIFSDFVKWLAPRAGSNNTVVKTVGDVIGGAVKPVVTAANTPAPGPGKNGVINPGFETAGATGALPQCWAQGGYGTNTAAVTVGTGRTGKGPTVKITSYTNGDAKVLPVFDGGTCSPTVTPGHTYSLRAYYKSTAVTQFAVYLRTASGNWQYWTSSPWFSASSAQFNPASWTTPAIPAGMTGISFGLNLFNVGTLTTDDYALYDSVGAPAAATAVVAAIP